MTPDSERAPVAVVGAGFSGTMVAIHLRRVLPADRPVLLCERSGDFARGLAYATANPDHLLNVRATNMSAFPDEPEHFSRWVEARGPEDSAGIRATPAGTFVARGLYGSYLADLLSAATGPDDAGSLRLVHDAVTDLTATRAGADLVLGTGRRLAVAGAVLACGNLRKAAAPGGTRAIDPWGTSPLDGLSHDRPLLIVGTGLTMIDAVSALRRRGFTGRIVALSRRGLLPQTHAPAPPWPTPGLAPDETRSLLRLLVRIRAEIAAAAGAGLPWHSVVDSLRPLGNDLWRGLPPAERARFLRHLRAYWDVHRHRTAPPTAAMIARERHAGGLSVMRGKIAAIADRGDHALVTLRERGASATRDLEVQAILDASGVSRSSDTDDPLLRRLMIAGQIRPDPLGLGLDVADDLSLVDTDGGNDRPLWTLGPLLRGTLWECTAVPDIRVQAATLARTIAARI